MTIHPEAAALAPRAQRFTARREALRRAVGSGVIVMPGQERIWRNPDNPFAFRQNSHILYLAPFQRPGCVLVLDADEGLDHVYGPAEDADELVWHGPQPSLTEEALAVGILNVHPIEDLAAALQRARRAGRQIHSLPLWDPGARLRLAHRLGLSDEHLAGIVSERLVLALGDLRLRKDAHEVAQIEQALTIAAEMFGAAFGAARPGRTEAAVRAAMARVVYRHDAEFAFAPIVTIRGEVLHNHAYANAMEEGDLLLIDAGVETAEGYASDLTRTVPIGGRFSERQRGMYDLVLEAHRAAIAAMRPGASFRDVHDLAARVLAAGLGQMGLMKGDAEEAVSEGAHALFFVHGLGHPLGLDVHDLHDLGDRVAYPPGRPRSSQFGTRFLRFGRDLEEGMVMTVEPGIYFIPALIDRWRAEARHARFIDYEAVAEYRAFGGIRIEDDVYVHAGGARILGPAIPRTADDVAAAMAEARA